MVSEVFDLFIDLDATDDQIDFPVIYTIARDGIARRSMDEDTSDLRPLFDHILQTIPPPAVTDGGALQMLVTNLDYNEYVGRLAIGRIFAGTVAVGDQVSICKLDGSIEKTKVSKLFVFEGLDRTPVERAEAGEIIALAGIENIFIGETVSSADDPRPLPQITVDEPTISMIFSVNTSPFSGRDGKFVTSRKLRERLDKETLGNVSIRVESTGLDGRIQGLGPRGIAARDSDRDDAARKLRASGFKTGSDPPGRERPQARTDRACRHRLS